MALDGTIMHDPHAKPIANVLFHGGCLTRLCAPRTFHDCGRHPGRCSPFRMAHNDHLPCGAGRLTNQAKPIIASA